MLTCVHAPRLLCRKPDIATHDRTLACDEERLTPRLQVIKKWLSYREEPLLEPALKPDEVREVRNIARRIAAILLLEPALDDAYAGVKGAGVVASSE